MGKRTKAEWYEDGLSLLESGFFDSAVRCFNQVLQDEPGNAELWALKATSLAGGQRYEEAIDRFNKALEIDSSNAEAWQAKATCLIRLRRETEAIKCQNEAERIAEAVQVAAWTTARSTSILCTSADGLVSSNVVAMAAEEEEAWFVYGEGAGATRLSLKDQRLTTYTQHDGLVSDAVRCVVIGKQYVWLGTDRGLSRFDKNAEACTAYIAATGLKGVSISDLAIDGEFLWLGTDSGLQVLDTRTGKSVLCRGAPDPVEVDCLLADHRRVWCGADQEAGGVSVFHKQTGVFRRLDTGRFVRALEQFPLGGESKIWAANNRGIAVIDTTNYETDQISLPTMPVTGIAAGVENLLIGTTRGLVCMETRGSGTETEIEINRTEIGQGKRVSALCASRTREWVAIEGEGVYCVSYLP